MVCGSLCLPVPTNRTGPGPGALLTFISGPVSPAPLFAAAPTLPCQGLRTTSPPIPGPPSQVVAGAARAVCRAEPLCPGRQRRVAGRTAHTLQKAKCTHRSPRSEIRSSKPGTCGRYSPGGPVWLPGRPGTVRPALVPESWEGRPRPVHSVCPSARLSGATHSTLLGAAGPWLRHPPPDRTPPISLCRGPPSPAPTSRERGLGFRGRK